MKELEAPRFFEGDRCKHQQTGGLGTVGLVRFNRETNLRLVHVKWDNGDVKVYADDHPDLKVACRGLAMLNARICGYADSLGVDFSHGDISKICYDAKKLGDDYQDRLEKVLQLLKMRDISIDLNIKLGAGEM